MTRAGQEKGNGHMGVVEFSLSARTCTPGSMRSGSGSQRKGCSRRSDRSRSGWVHTLNRHARCSPARGMLRRSTLPERMHPLLILLGSIQTDDPFRPRSGV